MRRRTDFDQEPISLGMIIFTQPDCVTEGALKIQSRVFCPGCVVDEDPVVSALCVSKPPR